MKRLPIKAASGIAKSYGLAQVILAAWDGERTHIVTYGRTVEDCAQAAMGGNTIKDALGWPKDLHAEPSRVAALKRELADARVLLKDAMFAGAMLNETREEIARLRDERKDLLAACEAASADAQAMPDGSHGGAPRDFVIGAPQLRAIREAIRKARGQS